MNEDDLPPEVRRTFLGTEASKQVKYKRWAAEMSRHGWDVRQPTPRMVRALALQNAIERLEKARDAAETEAAR